MKLSNLKDRERGALHCAECLLDGKRVNKIGLLEACEEEGYILVADREPWVQTDGWQPGGPFRFIPDAESPYGLRTRRIDGQVQIRPCEGYEDRFAECLAFEGDPVREVLELRDEVQHLLSRVRHYQEDNAALRKQIATLEWVSAAVTEGAKEDSRA